MEMSTKQQLEGRWEELKGALKTQYGQLTDSDFNGLGGNIDQLIGRVQAKTGAARSEIERKIEQAVGSESDYVGQVKAAVTDAASSAMQNSTEAAEQLKESMAEGYEQARKTVQKHPIESLAVCLGAGLITGVVLGLTLRSR